MFFKISNVTESFYSNYLLTKNSFLLCILIILLRDFCAFGTHWLQHNNTLLWNWHELHHSATQMTLLNEQRTALYEQIFNKIVFIPVNTLIGSRNLLPLPFFWSFSAILLLKLNNCRNIMS